MKYDLTDEEIIANALIYWRNHIQTGNMLMSSKEMEAMGRPEACRPLCSDQQEFVVRLEFLAHRITTGAVELDTSVWIKMPFHSREIEITEDMWEDQEFFRKRYDAVIEKYFGKEKTE